MKKDEKRVPPIGDPDVVRAGITGKTPCEIERDVVEMLSEGAGKRTEALRESAGWPSFVTEKKPGSRSDRGNATPTSTDGHKS